MALTAFVAIAVGLKAQASVFVKTNNADVLNLATSWTNNAVPGVSDVAQWDNTVSDAGNTTGVLGAATEWYGINILDPVGPIVIANDGNALTLGAGGIDMSAATVGLTLSNDVVLAKSEQTWRVASGQTLSLAGAFTRSTGSGLNFDTTAGGSIVISGVTASSVLPYSEINGTDVGAVDAAQNVTDAASVITYTQNTDANPPNLGAVTYLDITNGSAAGNYGYRLTSSSTTPVIVRFNVHHQFRNDWTYDVNSRVNYISSPSSIYLVTTNVGVQDVIVTGSTHAFRWNNGTDLVLDQENTSGNFIVNGNCSERVHTASNILTKMGRGRVIFNAWPQNTGPTYVIGGELMMNGTTIASASASVTINDGATLSGTGRISDVATNLAGGTIWPGTNGLGTFTISNLVLNTGSNLKFYDAALSTANASALLNLPGQFEVDGPVNIRVVAGHAVVGQYPLIQWTNAIDSGAFANLTLAALPLRAQGYLSNNTANSSVDLVITNVNEPISWAVGDGNWEIAGAANWVDPTSATTDYEEANGVGDSVLFDDSASGTSPITVTLDANTIPAGVTVNAAKDYTITGTGSIGGVANLTKSGSGTLTLSTTNSFTGGIDINGGVVEFSTLGNLGSGAINFGGGTLQYNGNTDDISVRTVTLNSGDGTIDTAGQNVSFANAIGNGGAGGLIKAGSGTLTLNGANTFNGNTVVSDGTLALETNTYVSSSSAIIVDAGATFDTATSGVGLQLSTSANQILAGVGTISGNVTNPISTTISPATNGVYGTLSINGTLNINGGKLVMDISTTNHDQISVSGNLAINGGSVLVITNTEPLVNGSYKLISYGGSLVSGAGSSGNLIVSGFSQSGKSATLSDETPGEIDLIVADSASDNLTWSGAGTDWDLSGTLNWLNGATAWAYTNGDDVIFNDSASGNSTVQLQTSLQPTSVVVSNTAIATYTFADGTGTGGGKIAGSASLIKDGTGTLIVQTANTYTGPTTVKDGTLQIGNGSAGDIGKGNVTNNGALVFNQGSDSVHTVEGQVSGSGSLTQQGGATVILAEDNTYAGDTVINSGALQLGKGGTAGSVVTPVITNNATLILNRSGSYALTNGVQGTGNLIKIGSGTVVLNAGLAYQGDTIYSNGVIKLAANDQLPDANSSGSSGILVLDNGNSAGGLDLAGFNETINAVSATNDTISLNGMITNSGASTSTTNTLTILGTTPMTFNGMIADNSSGSKTAVLLMGTNSLFIGNGTTYSGGTVLGEGAYLVANGGASVIGNNGNITMSNGSTFFLQQRNGGVFPNNNIIIPDGATAILNSSALGNGYGGNISGGPNSTNLIAGPISFGV
ncbi:MAG TPA: autotransporter-associated beta strand repeat-containing protein, partial [Verrucomicrobiae bacterium]|nr:autotransporter-associated beta strand repeat-containing protein [Verrucomicrobiae bacterium]